MKCTHCGWSNPPSYTKCYNCDRSLVAKAAATPVAAVATFPSFGMRAVAAGIDLAVMGLIALVLGAVAYFATRGMAADVQIPVYLVVALIAVLTPAVMDARKASPGKHVTEMRVVTARGHTPGVIRASIRHVLRFCLHFSLPFVLAFLERVLFTHRGLHNVITGCYVVNANAPAEQVRRQIETHPANGATKVIAVLLCTAVIGGVMLVGAGGILQAMEEPNPTRDVLKVVVADMRPITGHVKDYIESMQQFPESVEAMGLPQLPPGIARITMVADTASIHAVLDDTVAPNLKGKTLIWQTELKTRGGALRASRWHCGSIDITHDDLPYLCRSTVK